MNEHEFQRLLHAGSGRAILYAMENDVTAFREVILDACLHCYSIDVQAEGTRAGYLRELVNLLPDREFYYDKVITALPESGDDWDSVQRFRFVAYRAVDGDDRARRAIYDHFEPGPKLGEVIAIEFLKLGGLPGFIFAAGKIGGLLLTMPDEVDQWWLWWKATEKFGEAEALAALRQAAPTDVRLEAYRVAVEAPQTTPELPTTLSYAELRRRLPELRDYRLLRWGDGASPEELASAARGLVQADSLDLQIKHLRIFARCPFPLYLDLLLKLAASEDDSLAYAAVVALAQLKHPSVRELAFQLVAQRREGRRMAIRMLSGNFEPTDHERVLRWYENEPDRYIRHRMGLDLQSFWEDHPEPASEVRMLHAVYEYGQCTECREHIVCWLIELDALSPEMRKECAYDANDSVRELVAAPSASNPD
jgi:hypothetical protein